MMTQHIKNDDCTPRLRFPEFEGKEWNYFQAINLFYNAKEKNHNNSELPILAITQDSGAIPRTDINYTVIISQKSIENYKIVRKGDFIISLRSFQGGIEYSNFDGLCSPAYIILRKKYKQEFYDLFFSYFFKTKNFIFNLNKDLTGIRDGKIIPYNHFSKLFLPFPHIKEQQKIADCLTSLDDLITAHEQKAEALRQHKKGLMQRLLPAEGETTPRWRFPEFREAEEWTSHPLGTMTTKIGSGVTPKGGDKNYLKAGIPFVRSQNIGWGKLLLSDLAFIPRELHEKFLSTEILYNDVLLNITGASIGRCAIVEKNISGGNVNQHVCIIRTNENKLNSIFLMQYMISVQGQKQIDSFQAGGNRQGLNFAQIAAFTIPTPSLPEQQKIADCLSSLDERITAQEAKVTALREHKKGLMQRLFPQAM